MNKKKSEGDIYLYKQTSVLDSMFVTNQVIFTYVDLLEITWEANPSARGFMVGRIRNNHLKFNGLIER